MKEKEENLFLENKFSLPPSPFLPSLKIYSIKGTHISVWLAWKGEQTLERGTRFIVERVVFIYLPHTRWRIHENRAKRWDKSESRFRNLFISPCVARHCFFREKKACRLGIKRARCALTQALSPPQPLDKATFSLCSLNHANPAYNAYLLLCSPISIKIKKKKKREKESIYISNRLRNAL